MLFENGKVFQLNYNGEISNSSYRTRYFLFNGQEKNEWLQYTSKILNNNSTELPDSVMVHSNVTIPRYKLKDYFEENSITKVRIKKAKAVVINKKLVKEFSDRVLSKKMYEYGLFKDLQADDPNYKALQHYISINGSAYSKPELTPGRDYLIDLRQNYYSNKFDIKGMTITKLLAHDLYREKKLEAVYKILTETKANNLPIVWEEDLLPVMNKEGFDLDGEYLETINGMFESKNQENIDMALEMMCNVDLEENFLTIALLLNKHKDLFEWGSGLSLKRHRGFKTILNYFESEKISFSVDFRQFCSELLVKYKDDEASKTIITQFVLENINRVLSERHYNMSSNFTPIKIESIKIK